MALLDAWEYDHEVGRQLANPWYTAISACEKDDDALIRQYRKLTGRVQRLADEEGLAQELNKSVRAGSISACLKLTLKTHKPCGEVSTRGIHASPAYSFEGLSM